nr:G protein-coupled receptor [Proales similis]
MSVTISDKVSASTVPSAVSSAANANFRLSEMLEVYSPLVILPIGLLGNVICVLVFTRIVRRTRSSYQQMRAPINRIYSFFDCLRQKGLEVEKYEMMLLGARRPSNFKSSVYSKQGEFYGGLSSIYLYLIVLALCDMSVLLFGLGNDWAEQLLGKDNIKDRSSLLCKSLTFVSFVSSHSSSAFIVIINAIRFIAIRSPHRAASLTNVRNFKLVVTLVLFVYSLMNAHLFWTMRLLHVDVDDHFLQELIKHFNSTNQGGLNHSWDELKQITKQYQPLKCRMTDGVFSEKIWPLSDKLVYCFIPFVLLLFFNFLIIKSISKAQTYSYVFYASNLRGGATTTDGDHLSLKPSSTTVTRLNLMVARPTLNQSRRLSSRREICEKLKRYKKQHTLGRKFTWMLLGISFAFLLFTLPVVVLFVFMDPITQIIERLPDLNERNRRYELLNLAQSIASILMYVNHSTNVFIYIATSTRFRRHLKSIFNRS